MAQYCTHMTVQTSLFLFGENWLKANLQISKVKQTLYIGHLVKIAFMYSG